MDRRAGGIHIGTRGWVFPDDASGFYPEDLPEDWALEYYTTQFHALELPPVQALPDPETVAAWEEGTLEDAALSLPLGGDWARRLAAGGDLLPLARALEPLGEKLAALVWPQKPPTQAPAFWPNALHVDAPREVITDPHPATDGDPPGSVYRRLEGPGRYAPETLGRLADHLAARGRQGRPNFVFFTAVEGGKAILDAMTLQELVDAKRRV
ncbi:hypothetical protein AN478_03470 [Thiohalorhabdus denitrificans]|uniref:Uncharacterized conserved protein YecE, DUF72 family n=1 Tax=Thiohalorhabdus denitrificans TaxID=381306 RepID=A0A0P9CWG2_9GAMM|nr:DUF72 domain-containing protein [Thiohalorhabdus denitrificans]KPV41008.1 hypothetical protein AN478_03470 [Thiohalorhabdus denitrificans]SCY41950.1 Uncharacterized conserved protein YecE, DUF72 family [Thiohalorhabdus denitrificans]